MDPFIIIAGGFLLFLGLALCRIFWEARRSSKMINDWANEHGYMVLNKKQPLVNLGRFRWENPRGRIFYHVTVHDGRGQSHTGWISCGSEWLGLLSNKVEVRWNAGEAPLVAPQLRQPTVPRLHSKRIMPLVITTEHDAAMRAHGAQVYPHECCGFLVGRADGDTVTVTRTVPAANTREDSPRNRFEIDPGELVRTDRAARAEGLGVVGFYHSHPDAPAQPSDFDREHAWPGYCYVIVSVRQGVPQEMRNWLLREDRSGFDDDAVTFVE